MKTLQATFTPEAIPRGDRDIFHAVQNSTNVSVAGKHIFFLPFWILEGTVFQVILARIFISFIPNVVNLIKDPFMHILWHVKPMLFDQVQEYETTVNGEVNWTRLLQRTKSFESWMDTVFHSNYFQISSAGVCSSSSKSREGACEVFVWWGAKWGKLPVVILYGSETIVFLRRGSLDMRR